MGIDWPNSLHDTVTLIRSFKPRGRKLGGKRRRNPLKRWNPRPEMAPGLRQRQVCGAKHQQKLQSFEEANHAPNQLPAGLRLEIGFEWRRDRNSKRGSRPASSY